MYKFLILFVVNLQFLVCDGSIYHADHYHPLAPKRAIDTHQIPDFCKIKAKDPFFLQNLKKLWIKFKLKSDRKFPTLTIDNLILKLMDEDDRVLILRKQLLIHGDLTADLNQEDSNFFDKHLEFALKKFQQRHCLNDDGVVGKKTAMYLNPNFRDF